MKNFVPRGQALIYFTSQVTSKNNHRQNLTWNIPVVHVKKNDAIMRYSIERTFLEKFSGKSIIM
jgi:hypothetical protein